MCSLWNRWCKSSTLPAPGKHFVLSVKFLRQQIFALYIEVEAVLRYFVYQACLERKALNIVFEPVLWKMLSPNTPVESNDSEQ